MIIKFKEYKLITESPDSIKYDGKTLQVEDNDAYPIYSELDSTKKKIKNVLIGHAGFYHGDLGQIEGEDIDLTFRGRIWTDSKIIAFFVYPSVKLFKQMMKKLGEQIGQKIFNNGWKIEIITNTMELDDIRKNRDLEPEDIKYQLIPVEGYYGAEDLPKEVQIMHLMNWQEKEKMKKETGTKGFGSAKTAWEEPFHNIKWRQALYQENKNTK
jgi:hypothetical protein